MPKKIAVLRGGDGSTQETSLKSGKHIIEELGRLGHEVIDILVDGEKKLFEKGKSIKLTELHSKVEKVINALHGDFAEDGALQNDLERIKIPYTGSSGLGSIQSLNKDRTKNLYKNYGLKTPLWLIVDASLSPDEAALKVFRSVPFPMVLKPLKMHSSIGVTLARDFESLKIALKALFEYSYTVLAEEYIPGYEATVGVFDRFRERDYYATLPVGIKKQGDILDEVAKKEGEYYLDYPGIFSKENKNLLEEIAIKAHKVIGLKNYSRSEFIINPQRGIYIIETNALPALHRDSIFIKSMEPSGISYSEFIQYLIGD
jgi:D-alanine-D-alanine ligase